MYRQLEMSLNKLPVDALTEAPSEVAVPVEIEVPVPVKDIDDYTCDEDLP